MPYPKGPRRVTRRQFLVVAAAGGALGVAGGRQLLLADSSGASTATVHVLDPLACGSGCGVCSACDHHAENKIFLTAAAAEAGRAHPGCRCQVAAVAMDASTVDELRRLDDELASGGALDRRWGDVAAVFAAAATTTTAPTTTAPTTTAPTTTAPTTTAPTTTAPTTTAPTTTAPTTTTPASGSDDPDPLSDRLPHPATDPASSDRDQAGSGPMPGATTSSDREPTADRPTTAQSVIDGPGTANTTTSTGASTTSPAAGAGSLLEPATREAQVAAGPGTSDLDDDSGNWPVIGGAVTVAAAALGGIVMARKRTAPADDEAPPLL